MIVLGFDTATPATAIGLLCPGGRALQARHEPGPGERPGHATHLLGLAASLLAQVGLHPREIDRIAVGVGPGTFTGLRVGVASARGLAQSAGAELVGVSSLRALTAGVGSHGEGGSRAEGVLAVLDARRGEAFAAAYLLGAGADGVGADGAAGVEAPRELVAAGAYRPETLGELLAVAEARAPRARWRAVGDGALLFRDELLGLGVSVPGADSGVHRIGGEAICRLGASAAAARAPEEILPDYVRRPDAELRFASGIVSAVGVPAGRAPEGARPPASSAAAVGGRRT